MKRPGFADLAPRYDLVIVGGGITGAGVLVEAARAGAKALLLEQHDFASGTSSGSSKLVHGGLRYLETGTFGLVYEALHERRLLLRNAPHLVRPLRFVIPLYRGARVARWKLRTGLTLYDLLAGPGNIRRSRPIRTPELLREFPGLPSAAKAAELVAAAKGEPAKADAIAKEQKELDAWLALRAGDRHSRECRAKEAREAWGKVLSGFAGTRAAAEAAERK